MLSKIIGWIVNKIITPVTFILFSVQWTVLVALPFTLTEILEAISNFFGFGFIRQLFFQSAEVDNSKVQLPWMFIIVLMISVGVAIVILVVSLFKAGIKHNEQNNLKNTIKTAGKAIVIMVALPLSYSMGLVILETFYHIISKMFITNSTQTELQNIYTALKPTNVSTSEWNDLVSSHLWNTGTIYDSYAKFENGDSTMTILLFGIITFSLLFAYFKILLSNVLKSIQVYFLMMIAPIPAAVALKDNGETLKKFLKESLKGILTIFVYQFLLKFLIIYLLAVMKIDFSLTGAEDNNYFDRLAVFMTKLVVILGGLFFVWKVCNRVDAQSIDFKAGIESVKNLAVGAYTGNVQMLQKGVKGLSSQNQKEPNLSTSIKNQSDNTPVIRNNLQNSKDSNGKLKFLPMKQ
ncbi:hypothetical protein VO56_02260 [Mycoplasmopsis gallinacea]|uniref:Uncharacterized protein n=1 Tax=Mycoplasmopsis gallinacea TaxID=29556 RepID=A0A0D5ZK05_9BACT|nr:hypothetical protein VO56_02260 [Mycoplasmopsis gallinacea]